MTTEQIFEWSALLTSPFIANVFFYLALPTISQRFPTTHQLIGWIALALGAFYLVAPSTFNLWFALCNVALSGFIFWLVWNKASKTVQHGERTIPVLFLRNPPAYGKNLLRSQ